MCMNEIRSLQWKKKELQERGTELFFAETSVPYFPTCRETRKMKVSF